MGHGQRDRVGSGETLPRGSHGLPPEFVVHSQRERLFAGMARVMMRIGYAATTVDDIATESRVSRRALYSHFSGKEDVLLQAQRAVADRIAAGAGPAMAEQGDWRAALRALLEWALEFFAREPALGHLALVEAAAATPASRRLQRESLGVLRALVARAAAAADSPLPELAVDGMVGGLLHAIGEALDTGDAATLPDRVPELMAWFLLVFDGREAAARELAATR